MKSMLKTVVGLMSTVALTLSTAASAADPEAKKQAQTLNLVPPRVISHEVLQTRLNDPSLRLLDARPRAEYEKGHIPGALWVDVKVLEQLFKPETVSDKAAWGHALAPLGIDANTEVFVYDSARQHVAARTWYLLGYANVEKIGLVDGGFPLWEKAKRPVTSEPRSVAAREFPVKFHERRVLSRADVQEASEGDGLQLLDARSTAEYRGEKKPANGGRAGHIPGARNVEGYDLVDDDGRFLNVDATREKLSKAGIVTEKPVIVYSNGSARASVAAFALRRAGIHARVYVPGLTEWAKDSSAELVEGQNPGSRAE